MRVLIPSLVSTASVGGVATYLANLESGLRTSGIDCEIADRLTPDLEPSPIRFLWEFALARREYFTTRAWALYRTIEDRIQHVDLVHTQDAFVSLFVRRMSPKTVVVETVHGTNYEHALEVITSSRRPSDHFKTVLGYHRLRLGRLMRFEKAGLNAADEVISVDSHQAGSVLAHGVQPDRVTVIHNAVDVGKLGRLAQNVPRYACDTPCFVVVRRLWPKNGVVFAVRAFLEWVGTRNVKFLIAGTGPQLDEIQEICASSARGAKVHLLGDVPSGEVPSLMSRALATLVPSVPIGGVVEATSFSALESLAVGVPVIASNLGGLAEIDGGTGVIDLVEPGSVPALVSALDRVWSCREKLKSTSAARKMHVLERFDLAGWAEKVVAVYDKALHRCAA
jgi:glycosyltransferase involved in cell wall biosynthesis